MLPRYENKTLDLQCCELASCIDIVGQSDMHVPKVQVPIQYQQQLTIAYVFAWLLTSWYL